ncbi:hypothetical protein EVAR_64932_1 [Eumeta japonica]|uniref:Uncharacterized protein n=1 Tax=Eumeta variegata TaxID=151549 RepID=A0A4C1ZDS5_EUMVA|nr:hypothetical protein EVAR_64932_1 [Eumeta japonica]
MGTGVATEIGIWDEIASTNTGRIRPPCSRTPALEPVSDSIQKTHVIRCARAGRPLAFPEAPALSGSREPAPAAGQGAPCSGNAIICTA